MVKYEIVNPVMGGTIKTVYEASSAEEAAKQFWETLTVTEKVFMDNLPIFAFTIKGGDKEDFFVVKEKPKGDDKEKNVDYTIENITEHVIKNTTPEERKEFDAESQKMQRQVKNIQKGGAIDEPRKRYKDSSSSSSNDLDDVDDYLRYIRKKQYANNPLWYWWYNPSIYRIRNIFTPVFRNVYSPYTHIWVPMR
ncbi:hypothetical protein BMW23_0460 [Bodo saltans virus]|uniref:Uncharacterized protein n=1 Tax=Bodo saltans virus TaxID=2024608 RepID=A0A2H4UUA3_9VIRU|nr:hypothetical protein QJ851_gp0449 [Bodo saltans virus]ATZ80512.1 hypothetical protein BMW23_0460 [Bodo saltans virus]